MTNPTLRTVTLGCKVNQYETEYVRQGLLEAGYRMAGEEEEADLCIRMARLGRIRLVPRFIHTSDRRIAAWGPWKANWIYFKVGMLWAFGLRDRMAKHYPDVR